MVRGWVRGVVKGVVWGWLRGVVRGGGQNRTNSLCTACTKFCRYVFDRRKLGEYHDKNKEKGTHPSLFPVCAVFILSLSSLSLSLSLSSLPPSITQ